MGGVGIRLDMVSAVSPSASVTSCSNAVTISSRLHTRRSLPLPRGLVESSSKSSLYVSRSDRLELACRGGGACGARSNGTLVRVVCAKGSDNGTPRPEYSSDAKIRSEVIAPFRSVRMFFYGAFMASGGVGGLIAITRLIAALNNAPGSGDPVEIAKGIAIDFGAVLIFALLYRSDSKARDKSLAKIAREENLSNLRLELSNNRVVSIADLRGTSRVVILAGPGSYIEEALNQSEPFKQDLLDRGVLVAAYATDGASVANYSSVSSSNKQDSSESNQSVAVGDAEKKWRATPIYTSEWGRWIDDQKKLANVPPDQPVYVSLRLDGRVRGSGIGIPSWKAMSVQLPPIKGIWGGVFDGMDGRV